jgi:hypothetical protein
MLGPSASAVKSSRALPGALPKKRYDFSFFDFDAMRGDFAPPFRRLRRFSWRQRAPLKNRTGSIISAAFAAPRMTRA